MGRFVSARPSTAGKPGRDRPLLDDAWSAPLPAIWEYLTTFSWDDGSERAASTLLIFGEPGVIKVCLNDRAVEMSLWAAGSSLGEALLALEQALASGTGEWRVKSQAGGSSRKKSS
jgi:hypothetical protein